LTDLAADLKRASAILAGADPTLLYIADAWAIWIGARDSVTFEDAVGAARNYRSALRRRRRDDLYAKIAQMNFPGLKGAPLARAVTAEIHRYKTNSWLRDRASCRRPAGANGLLYDLLALNEHPLGVAALRKLFADILRVGEYQNQALHSGEREENHLEYDDQVFEGSER
jgi:hypothetical protein